GATGPTGATGPSGTVTVDQGIFVFAHPNPQVFLNPGETIFSESFSLEQALVPITFGVERMEPVVDENFPPPFDPPEILPVPSREWPNIAITVYYLESGRA